ncbi:MAG: polysaccharide deacetylase family protein [Melioribacteraceae bacterium]|nr:polysaccharide deacetylase family protein [Melioribacteraceae bacterium]
MKIISNNIVDIVRKNKTDIVSILLKRYPEFIFNKNTSVSDDEIPIFTFHEVQPDKFEEQIKYLTDNGYSSLDSQELTGFYNNHKTTGTKNVILTFDDGHKSLWTFAYPILKKYNQKAISFIIPGQIKESNIKSANLEDYWNGKANNEDISTDEKLCNWSEINDMHMSGIIDFQSHTLYHNSIFTSNKLIDFINPVYEQTFWNSIYSPVLNVNGVDSFDFNNKYGQPVYQSAPAMSAKLRFIEDENMSRECINFVNNIGSSEFFSNKNWKKELESFFLSKKKEIGESSKYITKEEKYLEIKKDLNNSKLIIEERLNKKVTHLCYPWYVGSELSVNISKELGYKFNYWGFLRQSKNNGVNTDPFYLSRLSDDYIFLLPGKDRKTIKDLFLSKINKVLN